MSKLMIIPSSLKMIEETLKEVDSYLIGVEQFSVNLPIAFSMEEIIAIDDLLKANHKELFISLNKNMFNEDIEGLKEILLQLEKLSVKAIFFYDIAIVNLKKKLNLKTDLVWSQEHFTTNYQTVNYWYDKGVSYTRISNEIMLKEILEIKKNTNSKLIVPIFGYIPMFASKRRLVQNYKNYFKLKDNSNIYYMKNEGAEYPLVEQKEGTYVYYSKVLNGKKYKKELEAVGIEYFLFNSFLIESFSTIIKLFQMESTEEEINKLVDKPTDDAFFDKGTIYKVK